MRVFLFVALALAIVAAQEDTKPTVDTSYGKLEGDTDLSRDGRMYYQFKGIPYAKAERFKAPVQPDKWTDVKDATKYKSRCVHRDIFTKTIAGEEDCLFLNVFTPKMNKEGDHKVLLPVMVWFHPGAFKSCGGDKFNPKYFMDQDVIIVTFNFRLGAFGFLNTGDENAQGNQALKDQNMALKWVQENIENFAGDKSRVTIFGSSSGAAAALYHLISPMSKGLFQNAIAQSGSPLSRLAFLPTPIKHAKRFGEQVGCPIDSSENLVTCLKGMDPKDILEKQTQFNPLKWNLDDVAHHGPSIETILKDQTEADVFLADTPYKLLTEGKVSSKVPLIVGQNEWDGLTPPAIKILNNTEALENFDKNWLKMAPSAFKYEFTAKDKDALSLKIREYYFGDKPINEETRHKLAQLFSDRFFFAPNRFGGKVYSKLAPLYLYLLDRRPQYSFMDLLGVGSANTTAVHLDDLPYLFKLDLEDKESPEKFPNAFPEITKDHKDYEFSKNFVALWTSFAETGKPTKLWGDGKVEWKKVEYTEKPKWLDLNDNLKILDETNPTGNPKVESFIARMDFWHKVFAEDLTAELETPPKEKF